MGSKTNTLKSRKYKKMLEAPEILLWREILVLKETIYSDLESKLLDKFNCTYPRFRLLFILYFEAPCSSAYLAKRLNSTRSNLSAFLKRLDVDGFIETCPESSTDTRPKFMLSKAGLSSTEEIFEYHFANVRKHPLLKTALTNKTLSMFTGESYSETTSASV